VNRTTVRIANKLGMHMRAANVFADAASRWQSVVQVRRGEMCVNGKSIMGLMMLAAPCGTEIVIEADGPDEAEALQDLLALVRDGFGEELAEDSEEPV
jgi:phosphocarrier protein